MELSWMLVFKVGMSLAGVLTIIGMFSELTWPVKLKITAVMLVGIILIGFLAWPLVSPVDPLGVVSVPAFGGAIALIVLAVLAGFIGYFISWPDGRDIGIVAVPTGLAVWAMRCGSMADLIRLNPTLAQRQELLAVIKWEPVFWLAVVAAGFGGVRIGQLIASRRTSVVSSSGRTFSAGNLLQSIIAIVASIIIAQFCIEIFAQDVRIGSVVAQPSVGQIVFAVLVSFGIAAFVVKKFLNAGFTWAIISSALITGFVIMTRIRQDTIEQLIESRPPVFFPTAAISILPVQMVAFGVFGSIAGYWVAVRYDYWRKHL
jgi:hypothetical protein